MTRQRARESTASERLRKRITELQRLKVASYEEKLLGTIDEATWTAHNERWQEELAELQLALASNAPSLSRDEFLRKVLAPIELAQRAARQYRTHNAAHTAEVLRAPFEVHDERRTSHRVNEKALRRTPKSSGNWRIGWEYWASIEPQCSRTR